MKVKAFTLKNLLYHGAIMLGSLVFLAAAIAGINCAIYAPSEVFNTIATAIVVVLGILHLNQQHS